MQASGKGGDGRDANCDIVDLTYETATAAAAATTTTSTRARKRPEESNGVVDLTGETDGDALPAIHPKKRKRYEKSSGGPVVASEEEAPFRGMRGDRRVQAELKHAMRMCEHGVLPCFNLQPDESDSRAWHFELRNFDEDSEGGAQLNRDLSELNQSHGIGAIEMEARFPPDYPVQPFSLRVIRPRMQWYTGHVTAGGSVCLQTLAPTNVHGGWQPSYCFTGLLPMVVEAMINCEEVVVRTSNGPGGKAGPLRVDLRNQWHADVTKPYSRREAEAGYERAIQNHMRHGWLGPDIMLSERDENAVANSGSMCEQSALKTSAELSEVRALQLRIDNAAKEREKCMREYRREVEGVGAWRACAKYFYHEARTARKPLAQQRQQQHADFDGRDRDHVFDDVD